MGRHVHFPFKKNSEVILQHPFASKKNLQSIRNQKKLQSKCFNEKITTNMEPNCEKKVDTIDTKSSYVNLDRLINED